MSFVKTKQIVPFTQGASVTVASTASETTLVSSTGIGGVELLKNGFTVGKTYRVSGAGVFSNTGTPTLTLKVKFGSTVILSTGAVTTVTGATNREFTFSGLITVKSLGASGTASAQGSFVEYASTAVVYPMTNSSTVTVDTTANQTVGVTAQWGASSASNTITLTNLVLEELN